jgi:hypothetical protein
MTQDKKEQTQEKSTTTQPAAKSGELPEEQLDKVAGGAPIRIPAAKACKFSQRPTN